jgi:signal transduction histidine kinase
MVVPFWSGNVPGLSDLDLVGIANEIYDIHMLQAAQYFSQRDRDTLLSMSRRQRSIMDTVGRPFLLVDGNGFVIEANAACAEQLKSPLEALPSRDFLALCDEDTAQEMRRLLRQRRPTLQKHEFTGRLAAGPGQKLQFLVQPTFDSEGRRDGAMVCFEPADNERIGVDDVLDYVRRRVIDILPLPVQLFDEEGAIVHATEMARFFTFADNTEPLPYCCHFHRRMGEAGTACVCRQVFRTGTPHFEVVRLDDPDQTRWFSLGLLPIFAPDGHVTHVACGLVDQTAQKRLEKRMENQILAQQRSSLVSQIALTVAQQLRNPLGVVIGFAELMSKGLPPEQTAEVVNRILRNSLRCKEIVEDLLDFGQGTPLERVPTDMCAVLRESVRPMLTSGQNRCVEWRLPGEPVWVECVPTQLAQVIMGVLDNALRFAKSRVVCEIGTDAGRAFVSVADDGNGIPGELDEQVFEPFFTTRRGEGAVGLGLSLARSVVRDHGGDLYLAHDPEPELPGARLVIQLPATVEAQPVRESSPSAERDARTPQVLLVDDESDLLDMLTTALTMRGYEVDPVQIGADALERARAADYDAIVLDINLPGAMNGRELYLRLTAEKPDTATRVLFITADTLNFETHRFLETVNCPSLEKPFLISDFLAAMELLVKKPLRAQHSPLNT